MKNVYISFIIFISMIVVMIFSLNYLEKIYSNILPLNLQLEQSINSEDWKKSYELVTKLNNEWKRYSDIMCIFVHHAEIDNISSEVSKLTQYIKCNNKDESMSSLYVVKFFFEHILNLEKINFQNIL